MNRRARTVAYLEAFDRDTARVRDLKEHYERKGVSNKELRDRLTIVLNELLEPMRQRRAKYEGNMSPVREALEHGTARGLPHEPEWSGLAPGASTGILAQSAVPSCLVR